MNSNDNLSTAEVSRLTHYALDDVRATMLAKAGQEAREARIDLMNRIVTARRVYETLDRSIKDTVSRGISRPGRAKRKLHLPMEALVQHMEKCDSRARYQQQLLVMVPVERLLRAGLQRRHVFDAEASELLGRIAKLLQRRGAGHLPGAQEEVQRLCAQYPVLFGPLCKAAPVDAKARAAKANTDKALALHAKLLASGLLDPAEIVTLRKVFAQYTA